MDRKCEIIVGVSDMKVTDNPDSVLVTYSLGSCIGVSVYDPVVRVGGLLHFMLPTATLDPEKAKKNPCMFADTGIPYLFKTAYRLGANKRRMRVIVIGGAKVNDKRDYFNIGKRNFIATRELFWRNNVLINYHHVGGTSNRTFRMSVKTGKAWLKVSGEGLIEI
jgi:chemotaxis protein CheD